jgi:hypothetical protein
VEYEIRAETHLCPDAYVERCFAASGDITGRNNVVL